MLAEIGLGVIILAWVLQLLAGRKKEILSLFVLIYILGVVLLAIDGFTAGLNSLAILNVVSAIVAFLVLLSIVGKK